MRQAAEFAEGHRRQLLLRHPREMLPLPRVTVFVVSRADSSRKFMCSLTKAELCDIDRQNRTEQEFG